MELNKSTWKKTRFGDCVIEKKISVDAKSSGLERYVAGEHMTTEDLHLRRWGIIGDDYLGPAFHRKFEKGNILYGSRRTYLKKVAVADFEGITSNTTLVLTENEDLVVSGFIPFLMLSDIFTNHSVKNSKGSVNPYINYKDIAKFSFLLPPKEEQPKLAKLLWAVDDYLESLNKFSRSYAEIKMNINEVLIYQGTHSEVKVKPSPIGLIPEQWGCERIDSVIEFVSGMVDPRKEPFLSMIQIGPEHIQSKTGKLLDLKTAHELKLESSKYLFDEEHVIYSKIRPYLMKVAVPNIAGLCSADMYALKAKHRNINKYYLQNYLLSRRFTDQATKFQTRTGMPKINREELGSIFIPIPPQSDQQEIVAMFEKLESAQHDITNNLNLAKSISGRVINQIFS